MGNKNIGEVELVLQIHEQVNDLRLNRDVQCAYRFIANNEFGLEDKRTGDADALTLTTGKFMG